MSSPQPQKPARKRSLLVAIIAAPFVLLQYVVNLIVLTGLYLLTLMVIGVTMAAAVFIIWFLINGGH